MIQHHDRADSIATHRIRPAAERDADEMARLFTQLGHPTTATAISERWEEWAAAGNNAFVSEGADGVLNGLVTLHRMLVFHRPRPVGRITALVVDETMRGRGIGRALVLAAEASLTAAGCGMLELTSNMRRADAHAFYERLGYECTSFRFMKLLRASSPAS